MRHKNTMENNNLQPNHQGHAKASAKPAAIKKQRQLAILVAATLLVLLAGVGYLLAHKSKTPPNSSTIQPAIEKQTAKVSITSSGFNPATIEVKAGSQVTWTNTDNTAHQVSADPHPLHNSITGFNSNQVLNSKDSFSFIFEKAGTYHVHDEMHPLDLRGTVIVK
jgi:plastocyanin